MRIVGVVVELGVPEESGWVELIVATDNGLDVGFDTEEGVGLPVKFTGAVDVGRAEVLGLANLLVGLGSSENLDFDLPNPKSLAKNPGFLTFGYTSNGLRITGTVKEIRTGGGGIGLLFSSDEGGGGRSGRIRGELGLSAEVEAIEN